MERITRPVSGYVALLSAIGLLILSAFLFFYGISNNTATIIVLAILSSLTAIFLFMGIIVISPNHSSVLTFFGKYVATVKENGMLFVNPLYKKQKNFTACRESRKLQTESER